MFQKILLNVDKSIMEAYVSEQKPHALSSTYRCGYNLYFEIELRVFVVIGINLIGRYNNLLYRTKHSK